MSSAFAVGARAAREALHLGAVGRGDRLQDLRRGADDADPLAASMITAAGAMRPFSVPASATGEPVPPSTVLVKRGARTLSPEKSEVRREIGEQRADPRCGRRDGVAEHRRPEVELVVADRRCLDAERVEDGDVGAARRREADPGHGIERGIGAGMRNGPGQEVVAARQDQGVGVDAVEGVDQRRQVGGGIAASSPASPSERCRSCRV